MIQEIIHVYLRYVLKCIQIPRNLAKWQAKTKWNVLRHSVQYE